MSLRSPRGGKKASTPHVSPLGHQAHTGSLQETNLLLVWCSCRAVPATQSLSKDEELLLRGLDQGWALLILLRN